MNIKFGISTIANRRKFKVAKYNLLVYAYILVIFVLDIFHHDADMIIVYSVILSNIVLFYTIAIFSMLLIFKLSFVC